MEDGILTRIIEGLLAVMLTVGGWLWIRAMSDISALDEKLDKNKDDLASFKTEVANNYAKEVTMQASLGRLHDRIDSVADDIKTLLQRVK